MSSWASLLIAVVLLLGCVHVSAQSLPPSSSGSVVPVGATASSFRVDESGAATYTIPILSPSGVAGVTPQLSINYSSQGGAGLVGYGMNLSGLGGISRCRQTLLQDSAAFPLSWGESDRFCLNGQRLMLVSGSYGAAGSTYKTEIDSYVVVTARGGTTGNPDYFEVEAKDGSTSTFGSTADSKVAGASNLAWALSRFKDNLGNRIDYVYEGDNTTGQRIKRIDYAYAQVNTSTNAKASIVFDYTDRIDAYRVYISGQSYRYSKKLTNIKTYNNNALERTYNFYYQARPAKSLSERLDQVEECFGASCYPRMSFSYTPERDYKISSNGSSLDIENLIDYKFFDINGDGILDIAWVSQYPINAADFAYKHVVKFALGTGVGYLQKSYERVFYGNLPSDTTLHVIDYNADGRQDLLVRSYDNRWHALVAQPMVTGEWTFGIAPGIPFQNRHVGFVD